MAHNRITALTMDSISFESHTNLHEELFQLSCKSKPSNLHVRQQISTPLSRSNTPVLESSLVTRPWTSQRRARPGITSRSKIISRSKSSFTGRNSMIPILLTSTPFGWTEAWRTYFFEASAPTSRGGLEASHQNRSCPAK